MEEPFFLLLLLFFFFSFLLHLFPHSDWLILMTNRCPWPSGLELLFLCINKKHVPVSG